MKHDGIKWRVCHKVLVENGFTPTTCKGSHQKYEKDGNHIVISRIMVNAIMWRRIVKEFGLRV